MTRNPMTLAATLAIAALIPAAALAKFAVGDTVGTDPAEIRAAFEAEGYTVTEVEIEDGEIEVEYVEDGVEFEVTIAAETGLVSEIETEDDDD
jgi:uncharacterized membrane protein YkoI